MRKFHNEFLVWMIVVVSVVGRTTFAFVPYQYHQSIKQRQRQQDNKKSTSKALFHHQQNNKNYHNRMLRTTFGISSSSRLFAITNTNSYDKVCDVLVLGSGPAARAIASLVSSSSSSNIKVLLADENWDREWVPNYGVWQDEWQSIVTKYDQQNNVQLVGGNVGLAIDHEWNVTDCYFGGSFDIPMKQRLRIDRPYYRVDKHALQKSLSLTDRYEMIYAKHISQAVGLNMYVPSNTLIHDQDGTTIQLQMKDSTDRITVHTKFIIDCTGHESLLIMKDVISQPQHKPGYQIAYGALVDIDESDIIDTTHVGPYDKKAMTLFDYRTDHYDTRLKHEQDKLMNAPTFMYVMPGLRNNQVFFEETSLVARPAMSFEECKERCYSRLEYLGIKVTKIHEEEYCYIPMGGSLPARDQRIIALGGSAAMVHPSTGYHLCRCLIGAADVAQVLIDAFETTKTQQPQKMNLNQIVASCYQALWSPENIMQRNFAVYGGEFLMKQNVVGLRGFFNGFFNLPMNLWAGFLAGWPGLPNNIYHESWNSRLWYGLNFISKLPIPVAINMLFDIISYTITEGLLVLPQTVMPFLGQPIGYEHRINEDRIGDVAAKAEGRRMILESQVKQQVPVSFIPSSSAKDDTQQQQKSSTSPKTTKMEEVSSASFQ